MDITLIHVGLLIRNESGVVEVHEPPRNTCLVCAQNPDKSVEYMLILDETAEGAGQMFEDYLRTTDKAAVVFEDLNA